jgi:hypothetical protein
MRQIEIRDQHTRRTEPLPESTRSG